MCIEGEALALLNGVSLRVTPGSALVIPPHTDFSLETPAESSFSAVVVLPIGGQGIIGDAPPFTPPWAQ